MKKRLFYNWSGLIDVLIEVALNQNHSSFLNFAKVSIGNINRRLFLLTVAILSTNILKEKVRFHKSFYWYLFALFLLTVYPAYQLVISLQLIGELLILIAITLVLINYILSTSLTNSFSIQPTFTFPLKFYWIPKLTLKNYAC